MGYETEYTIVIDDMDIRDENGISFHEALTDVSGYEVDDNGDEFYICGKWYDWISHMLELSKRFPSETITVYGIGESSGDIWWAKFLNGKTSGRVGAEIIYPPIEDADIKYIEGIVY